MTARPKRAPLRQVRMRDCRALRLLDTPPLKWGFAERPRAAAVDGGTDDPRWRRLRQRYEQRERRLIPRLAAAFRISESSPEFWSLLSHSLLGLFPALRIDQETRGQWMNPERARVIEAVLNEPGKQYANVAEAAARSGVKPATLERQVSERKKRLSR